MMDNNELKRLAEAVEACTSMEVADEAAWMRRTTGEKVLELFEELERVVALNHQQFGMALRKNQEVADLKAENEALRKVANELRRFASCEHLHHDRADWHEADEPCKVLVRIDSAMSKEPKA